MAMFGRKSEGIMLDVRKDGIYIVLDNSVPRDTSIIKSPEIILDGAGLLNVDFDALNEAFADTRSHVERKITESTVYKIVDEMMTVEISRDQMEASVKFFRPGFFGRVLSSDEIMQRLKDEGVVFGVLTDVIKRFPSDKVYGVNCQVAVGKPPVLGKDGTLEYKFDISSRNNRPKVLEDGSVNYKETNYILKAEKFQVLAVAHQPQPGQDGFSVLGQVVGHKQGKPAPRLPKGKNTFVSDNGVELVAELAGQIVMDGSKVNVLPTLDIRGDVGNETGNVDFAGSVFVSGNVMSDFILKATGDIEIKGAAEGAHIEAGGNVNLLGGIKGMGKGVVKAGGNIFVKYAERATLISDGNIEGESIMHSDVKCRGILKVEGRKGLLVGGNIYAGKSVTAKVIGSSMATATEITVGHSPDILDKYRELEAKHKQLKADYDKESLMDNYKASTENMRLRAMHAKIHLRVEMDKVLKEMNELLLLLNSNEGVINASQTIYTGVKAMIGGVTMRVTDELIACSLRNSEGRIVLGSYIPY